MAYVKFSLHTLPIGHTNLLQKEKTHFKLISAINHRPYMHFLYRFITTRSNQSALDMCNLSWTPPLLEKDNSKNNPGYNTQV